MEQFDEILIDEKNKANIRDIVRASSELQSRLQLIMQTIVNVSGAEGVYQLSEDLTKLIRVEQENLLPL